MKKKTSVSLVNYKTGFLLVVGRSKKISPKHVLWDCRCVCGKLKAYRAEQLKKTTVQSCGCKRGELLSRARTTHGYRGQRKTEYIAWTNMKQRCFNPADKGFSVYGGRGIRVCKRWLKFENFLADMGPKPSGLTLERNDSNGNYEPSNCQWASYHVQALTRRKTDRFLESVNRNLDKARLAKQKSLRIGATWLGNSGSF